MQNSLAVIRGNVKPLQEEATVPNPSFPDHHAEILTPMLGSPTSSCTPSTFSRGRRSGYGCLLDLTILSESRERVYRCWPASWGLLNLPIYHLDRLFRQPHWGEADHAAAIPNRDRLRRPPAELRTRRERSLVSACGTTGHELSWAGRDRSLSAAAAPGGQHHRGIDG